MFAFSSRDSLKSERPEPGLSGGTRAAAIVLGLIAFGFAAGIPAQTMSFDGTDDVIAVDSAIETTGDQEPGIRSTGAGADIDINDGGSIETSGRSARGIESSGANAQIDINSGGLISTTGEDIGALGSVGIYATGSNVRIHVHQGGSIKTTGESAYGINSLHQGFAAITVDGTIETTGDRSYGIHTGRFAADVHIAGTGLIRTTGDGFAHGVTIQGMGSMVTVDGMIETGGQDSFGILTSSGPGIVVTVNEGAVIQTAGFRSTGIVSSSDDTTVTVNGKIETVGPSASGIFFQSADAEVTVNGIIKTTGAASHGIVLAATGDTEEIVTINGVIDVKGRNSYAVVSLGSATVRLRPGARVTGGFHGIKRLEAEGFGGSRGPSHSFVASGAVELRAINSEGVQPVLVGSNDNAGVIAVLDPTASAMQRDALTHVTRLIHGAVHNQSTIMRSAPDSANHSGRRDWAVAIGGDFERDDDGAALGWDGEVYGAVGGVESMLGDDTRVGVVGAFVRSDFETDARLIGETNVRSIDADTKTAVLGVYGKRTNASGDTKWDLTGSFLGGYSDHEIDRRIRDHDDPASGSYKSWFASAAVGAKWYRPISDKHELRPSVRVDGLIARHRSYSESGAGISNIAYDSWTSASANGRAQMAVATRLGSTTELEGRVGAALRLHADDDVTARLVVGGDSVNYDVPGDDSVYGGFIGARLTSMHRDRFLLLVDAEYGRGSDDDEALSARLQLSALF